MKKVYQKLIDQHRGDCMQAVIASLFELELDDVPKFIELGDKWFRVMYDFYRDRGYSLNCVGRSSTRDTELLKRAAKVDGGVNGFFHAAVKSKLFPNTYHAVVIDTDLNIVHDPNPSGIYLECTPDDVEMFDVVSDITIGKTGNVWKRVDWDNLSEEERDANTWRTRYDENGNLIVY